MIIATLVRNLACLYYIYIIYIDYIYIYGYIAETCSVVVYIIKTRQVANKGSNYHFCLPYLLLYIDAELVPQHRSLPVLFLRNR
jgi:hypothetical protein